jgi:RNA polymerase sigma-70 factor, ECF subfamily
VSLEGEGRIQRFEKHILVHLAELYRTALRLTGQPSDAEDLVQETCLRAFKALDQLRYLPAAKVWAFSILRSVFLRQAERRPSQGTLVSLEDIDASLLTPGDAIHDAYESLLPTGQALLQETRDAILRLPVPYREAVILAHVGGFSYREIAQILGVPTGTVMSRLFRGRRLLRAYLGQRSSRLESTQ